MAGLWQAFLIERSISGVQKASGDSPMADDLYLKPDNLHGMGMTLASSSYGDEGVEGSLEVSL